MPGYEFWADYFLTVFVPQVDAFAGSLSARVLPAFEKIDEEAKQVAETQLRRRSAHAYDDEPDWASLAEQAHDYEITYYVTMYQVIQGIVNLFAVGLWHLFEQQLAYFARHALPYTWSPPNPPFKDVRDALREMSVDMVHFPSYPQVEELNWLANCAKHGDGPSCGQLRARRPELFEPSHHGDRLPWAAPVIAPLGGEHLYLTAEGFNRYADAVRAFWSELGAEVERLAR